MRSVIVTRQLIIWIFFFFTVFLISLVGEEEGEREKKCRAEKKLELLGRATVFLHHLECAGCGRDFLRFNAFNIRDNMSVQ